MPAFRSFRLRKENNSMQARIKATLLYFKSQLREFTRERRLYKSRLKTRDARIARLESKNAELRQLLQPHRVFNHVYPAQMVSLAVFMVVSANSSLRCAGASVEFLAQMMGWEYGRPSASTVRNWVLRCGCHALKNSDKKEGKYVAIIDESIQIGKEKLLLLLGFKQSEDYCNCAPLTGSDVEVLGLEVRSSWTGQPVAEFIKRCLTRHPDLQISHMVSDRGTSLLAAMRKLKLPWVGDCSHMMMNAVKQIFAHDAELHQFYKNIGTLRRQLTLTDWGFLTPPTLRDKDRFLRIFTLVDWSERMDSYWEKLAPAGRQHIDFYRQAPELLQRMRQIRQLIVLTSNILKTAGLSQYSYIQWKNEVKVYANDQGQLTPQTERFVEIVDKYFEANTHLFLPDKGLLCCSDIIESTFGRYKNKGGMKVISADVLSIALYNRKIDTDFIQEAMINVHQADLEQWQQENICENRYRLLRRMNRELKSVA